jgi:hypothetical protein
MNDLIKLVTPLTRGIIWLVKDASNTSNPRYNQIDYLLDGLLTANLKASTESSNKVIFGQNFNQLLHVMIVNEIKSNEIQSFVSLFKDLGPENDILIIDEWDGLSKLKAELKEIHSNLKVVD